MLLHGGCQICSGDSTVEDPSGSDTLDVLVLDISPILSSPQVPATATLRWFTRPTLGTPLMPARKGHAVITSGCSSRTESASAWETGSDAGCIVLWFGGWNPRWPHGSSGHTAVHKLDVRLWAWSKLPNEGMRVCCCSTNHTRCNQLMVHNSWCTHATTVCPAQDVFQAAAARAEPSALCTIGPDHFLVNAPYIQGSLLASLPREHTADALSLPRLLPRTYSGAGSHVAADCVLSKATFQQAG